MRIEVLRTEHGLSKLRGDWDRLVEQSGLSHPFVGWHWATQWWRHYGAGHEPAVCVARRNGTVTGIAPWYIERFGRRGTVRWLGSGEVCAEYVGLLCDPAELPEFCAALLDTLDSHVAGAWDAIDLSHMPAVGPTAAALRAVWERSGRHFVAQAATSWQIKLPESWDAYVRGLSPNRRSEVRRLLKRAEAAGIRCEEVCDEASLPEAWQALVHLHQKRWTAAGERGCFASARFEAFHRSLLMPLHRAGQLRFSVARTDRQIVAAAYCLSQARTVYYYQGGYEPECAELKLGTLLHLFGVRRAIERGDRVYDFMVGDEEYKRRWSNEQCQVVTLLAASDRPQARFRLRVGQVWARVKHAARQHLRRALAGY